MNDSGIDVSGEMEGIGTGNAQVGVVGLFAELVVTMCSCLNFVCVSLFI